MQSKKIGYNNRQGGEQKEKQTVPPSLGIIHIHQDRYENAGDNDASGRNAFLSLLKTGGNNLSFEIA
jgi:hypothetical protein